jgi:hypothetical protein
LYWGLILLTIGQSCVYGRSSGAFQVAMSSYVQSCVYERSSGAFQVAMSPYVQAFPTCILQAPQKC